MAQKGNFLSALTLNSKKNSPWIVNSGASDHITGNATLFRKYYPCKEDLTVKIADGYLSMVAGTGSIIISEYILVIGPPCAKS